MISSIKKKSIWWLPSAPHQKIPGYFEFTSKDGITIDLIGVLGDGSGEEFECINGFIDSKAITLYDSFIIERAFSLPGVRTCKIRSNFAFIGRTHFLRGNELKFTKAIFNLNNHDEWVNIPDALKIEQGNDTASIVYTLPKEIPVKLNRKVTFKIIPNASVSGIGVLRLEGYIKQTFEVSFKYRGNVSFKTIIDDTSHYQNFITLCSQKATFPTKFEVLGTKAEGYRERHEVLFTTVVNKEQKKQLEPQDFLLTYQNIKLGFSTILQNWFQSQESMETCYIPYFNNFYGRFFYISDSFLNVSRAIEAFHRDSVGERHPAGRKYFFEERVKAVFEISKASFNPLLRIRNYSSFAKKIKEYRNDFTHSNPIYNKRDKRYLEVYLLTEKLTIILGCTILIYNGIEKTILKERLMGTTLYNHLRNKRP